MRSAYPRFVRSALELLICISVLLIIHLSSIAPVRAATPPQSGNNLIRVWTVGSPHTGVLPAAVVPPELRRQAENLGYTIEVKTFRASGFAAKFREALQEHNEPEILTFDNYGVLSGIRTPNGWIDGIVTDPQTAQSLVLVHQTLNSLQRRGWVMLVRSATNHEAARALSRQPVTCNSDRGPAAHSMTIDQALQQASEAATFAARAYLTCDQSTLAGVSDPSRLGRKCFLPDSDTQVDSVKACRVAGNRNLAFVTLTTNFTSQVRVTNRQSMYAAELGQQPILAVLRNHGGVWRLLAMTHDPLNTFARTTLTTPAFDSSLDDAQAAAVTLGTAQLLTPEGEYPLPNANERFGDFLWEPSQSTDVIGQVVEFVIGKDSSRGFTRLFFLSPRERQLSSGYLMSGGKSVWRVWSISKGGDISFSEQHTFTY
jgi:hypothetical protein